MLKVLANQTTCDFRNIHSNSHFVLFLLSMEKNIQKGHFGTKFIVVMFLATIAEISDCRIFYIVAVKLTSN